MSRAAWAALVIGAAVVAIIAVLLLMPGHLREELVARAPRHVARVERMSKRYNDDKKRLDVLINKYPKYMKAQREVKQALFQLKMHRSALERARATVKKLQDIVERDKQEENHDLRQAFDRLNNFKLIERSRAKKIAVLIKRVAHVQRYRSQAPAIHKQALADAKRVATDMPPDALVAKLRGLRRTNPTASGFLARRLAAVPRLRRQAIAIFKQYQAARATKPIQYARAGKQADALHSLVLKMEGQINGAQKSLADLGHDVDKVLVDMKRGKRACVGARCSGYFHKYKIVRDGKVTATGWLPVSVLTYSKHVKNLGLVISSKPRGSVEEQANKLAHPPGYNYVGRPGYGHWRHPGDPPPPPGSRPPGSQPPGAGSQPPGAGAAPPPASARRGGRRSALADLAGMGAEIDGDPNPGGQPGDVWVFAAGRAPNSVCGPKEVSYDAFILYQRAQALREPYYGQLKSYGSRGSKSKKCYFGSAFLIKARRQARLAAVAAARRRRMRRSGYGYGRRRGYRSGRYRSGRGYRRSYGGYGK